MNTERRYADTTAEEFRGKHGATNGRYAREIADLRRWWVNEMMTSPVPLREMMTLFWHSHFASSIGKVLISQAMYEQNATQRKHALGNFRQLLRAMTIDGAMMIYLDLEDSEKHSPMRITPANSSNSLRSGTVITLRPISARRLVRFQGGN